LRLTLEEALAIGRRQRDIDDAALSTLHAQCDGWAAGLILMLAEKSGQARPASPAATTREAVFEYFAGTLFDRAPAALRRMLLSVAFLPYVKSDWANELSGDPEAAKMLEMLYRRHFFTQRRTDADGSYQFHALFQDFLKAQVRRLLPENDYEDLLRRSADLLRTARDIEAAFDLDCERASWDTAAELLIEEAERMIATGRWKTFAQYVSRLPGAQLDTKPWLAYWLGASLTPVDQDRARRQMESAFAAFSRSEDWLGKTLSAAGVLDTIGIEMRDMNRALPWIDTLTELIAVKNAFPSPDTEMRVLTAFLTPCVHARPDHPLLPSAVRRILEHIRGSENDNLRVWAAIGVLRYVYMTGAMDIVDEAVALITPVLKSPRVVPANVAHCFGRIGYCRYVNNDFTRAMQAYHRSRDIARAHGLVEQEHMVATWRGYCEWRMGDMDAVDKTVRELEASPVPASSYSKATFLLLKAEAAVGRGQLSEAIRIGTSALEKAELTGYRLSSVTFRAVLIDWLLRAREVDSAAARLDELEEAIERNVCMSCFRPTLWAHRFYLYRLLEDRARAHRCAGTALEEGRRYGSLVYMRWAETAMPHLCAYALEHNLHADYARALVAAYKLRPPFPDTEYWPWRVKLRTLGAFEIIAHDQTTQFARKAPKRLLQLLKAIVAFGGTDIPAQQLVDALWSDEDGDAGAHSLQVAITRLRKLLGEPDAVQVQDGRVSLNRDICWVDALAFERMLSAEVAWAIDRAERTCSLYQEVFLSGDADAPWAVPMRERLRTRYV
ncbi:MAG TPA: hypothetical protein VMN03_07220, partial [Burkholderiales bacterium]|nr:hypothetical protein [Burkholderiales bacterium]